MFFSYNYRLLPILDIVCSGPFFMVTRYYRFTNKIYQFFIGVHKENSNVSSTFQPNLVSS